MVNTVKFSQFVTAPLTSANNEVVGLENGVNVQSVRFLSWTTAGRPVTPFNGLLGINTTLQQYEFWDAIANVWTQLSDTNIFAILASHAVGQGASLIGLQDQSNVTSKTVQNLANAAFIAKTDNGTLQNAQFLGSLTTGIVKNTTSTGVLSISAPLTSIDGLSTSAHQFLITTASDTYGTLGPLTDGQLIIGDTGSAPVLSTLTSGGGVIITNGAGSITISATATDSPLTTKGDLWGYTTTNARLPAGSINGQILQVNSGAAAGLSYSTATYPATASNVARLLRSDATNWVETTSTFADTYAASGFLYANGANNVVGLSTAINGLPVTGNTGIPFILVGSGVTGNLLQSNAAAAPSWSTATYPSSTTINQLLYSSSNNVVAGLATVNSSILTTSSGGVPTWALLTGFANAPVNTNITSMTGLTGLLGAPTGVVDSNGVLVMQWTGQASAVNYSRFFNSATAQPVLIQTNGTDASIPMSIAPKNADVWIQDHTNTINPAVRWYNAANTFYVGFKAPTLAASTIWSLPAADGSANQFIKTDGAGNLAFASASSVGTALTKTDDTNVTLTLGGSPTTALLAATSLTLGWTGTLSEARGGTGFTAFGTGVSTALQVNVGSAGAFVVNGGALGTPSSGTLTNATGLPIGGLTGLGTGVGTALAVNVGSAGAFVTFNGAGGTPSSMVGTNITGTAAGLTAGTASAVAVGGITGLGTGVATALAANVNGSGSIPLITSGSWTPSDGSGAALSFTGVSGSYVRIGNLVVAVCQLTYPATADGSTAIITGLPFTSATNQGGIANYSTVATLARISADAGAITFHMYTAASAAITNINMSGSTNIFQIIYTV